MFKTDQEITEGLLFSAPARFKTDIGVVLGGRSTSGTLARAAIDGYKRGQFRQIAVSGGARVFQPEVYAALQLSEFRRSMPPASEFFSLKTEAAFIKKVLIDGGVREKDIIRVNHKGKNTGADLLHIKDVFAGYASATIIDLAPGQRRAIGTAIKVIGNDFVFVPMPVYPFSITRENWTTSKLARKFVVGESRKIDPSKSGNYIDKGFCVSITPDEIFARCAHLPRLGQ